MFLHNFIAVNSLRRMIVESMLPVFVIGVELFVAFVTLVIPGRMDQRPMLMHVDLLRESLVTDVTRIVAGRFMQLLVNLEGLPQHKRFATHVTLVFALLHVHRHVLVQQQRSRSEPFSAHLTFVLFLWVRFSRSPVDFFVLFKAVRSRESLVTFVTFERGFSSVFPHMNLKKNRVAKR